MAPFEQQSTVRHPAHGTGHVQADLGDTVVVRFGEQVHICLAHELERLISAEQALMEQRCSLPEQVVLKVLAHAIRSTNDTWGVFAPSRIDLLPHQLWVCRKVMESWPFRWLVADDVGLGKTVEAGLILWPLIAQQLVKRLLILTPASLVTQWQERLRLMFDLRLNIYTGDGDTARTGFWDVNSMVVASLHTLRDDHKGRHNRLLSAEPWDLVVVDEAHHVNCDEQGGKTLNYELLEQLVKPERTSSVLFFTGTPHRGKHYNFFALMELLRKDLFFRHQPPAQQLPRLREAMIRNNKQLVTDLNGNRLFHEPIVRSRTYAYTDEEAAFYNTLTQFILSGRAYASQLGQSERQAVILVLIVMQKLASSSVAAIRHTLRGRLERLKTASRQLEDYKRLMSLRSEAVGDEGDANNQRDEDKVAQMMLKLMENEQSALRDLLAAAEAVKMETKVEEILSYTRSLPQGTSVLFFTEYKATQSMLLSALMKEYGEQAVTFINGDGMLPEVRMPDGRQQVMRSPREQAADAFNNGTRRFLVSTEAAGEGIDLQERCHHLVHVDLPWNPMRLHQRHGRLNRYGQKHAVEVMLFRNPDTVEGQIWELLNEKLHHINESLASSMDDPEDLLPLVLGMTPSSTFDDLYFQAPQQGGGLRDWFDAKTATFGGSEAIDVVRELVGNAQRFDFATVSKTMPRLDLSELQPFFEGMLHHHRRQIRHNELAISFKTPEPWCKAPGVIPLQENLVFLRHPPREKDWRVTGVGSPVVNEALKEACDWQACFAVLQADAEIDGDLFVFEVRDRLTGSTGHIKRVICGLLLAQDGTERFVSDSDIICLLNTLAREAATMSTDPLEVGLPRAITQPDIENIRAAVLAHIGELQLPFRMPEALLIASLRLHD